ncbi:ADP-ribosylation factor-like protein 5 [Diplonema papillatum]|nr:ADP-ribosylation factor-like protein 5 [Diplonema papillatum]KAJ9456163.1 ADP-ribosylation factor-like protein 5 [Diplonema papillatum]
MGLLMSKVWSRLFGNKDYKIVIIGLDNAGKTTILYSLHLGEVVVTQPTIGSNVEEIKHKNINMVCWDLGGQESLRPDWGLYYIDTQALIMVVDSADTERIPVVRDELFHMLQHPELKTARILVYANKQDVPGALDQEEISNQLNLHKIVEHEWHVQACCALTGEGLADGMDWVAERIVHAG